MFTVFEVLAAFGNQSVRAVQGHPAVVPDDAAAAIGCLFYTSVFLMTDSSSPDSSPASRNTFAHHLGMKGFLLMEGLMKLVGMKTLYRLGRAAGAVAWYLLPQRRNIVAQILNHISTRTDFSSVLEKVIENFQFVLGKLYSLSMIVQTRCV